MPDVLIFMLLSAAWFPPLVLLHEAGHAVAAVALTDGDVSIDLHGGGLVGGLATYEPERVLRRRGEAWIAAAGPAASLVAALMLTFAWSAVDGGFAKTVLGAGALTAAFHVFVSAVPMRYDQGVGMGTPESDGRVIWRVLTGAPPGGIERELRRLEQPERGTSPVAWVALALIGALTLLVDPMLALVLVGLFGAAALLQRSAARR